MRLLKNDVLFIEVSVNKVDKSANRYGKVTHCFVVRNAKRIYLSNELGVFGLETELYSSANQIADEFFQKHFKAFVKAGNGKTNAYITNYDNVVVFEKFRDTTRHNF